MGDYFSEYQSYGQEFRDALTFHDFVQLKWDNKPRNHHRGNRHSHDGDLQRMVGRFHLPTFDGSSKCSAKAWVEKLDIYFQLNQMAELEAIKVAALHIEGDVGNVVIDGKGGSKEENKGSKGDRRKKTVEM